MAFMLVANYQADCRLENGLIALFVSVFCLDICPYVTSRTLMWAFYES